MIRHIIVAATIAMLLVATFPGKTRGEELPDVIVHFACLEADVTINLAQVYGTRGQKSFDDVAALYVENDDCIYIPNGYPAYIDRVVIKTGYKFKGVDTYVVEAHFFDAPPEKKFYFLFYGELPVKARRSAA